MSTNIRHVHKRTEASGLVTESVKIPKLQTHLTSQHPCQQTAVRKGSGVTLCIQRLVPALVLTDRTGAVPRQPEMWRVKLQLKQAVTGGALTNAHADNNERRTAHLAL